MTNELTANSDSIQFILNDDSLNSELKRIGEKILNSERITTHEGLYLYENGNLGFLGSLSNFIREKKNGDAVFFNRNFHIEPTNKCVFACKFCSYSRLIQQENEAWELSHEQMMDIVRKYDGDPVTEVHIVGGVHPKMNLDFFCNLIREIKKHRSDLHVKAFTAVELEYMFRKAKVSIVEGMQKLKDAGMDSMPGGGAEIFDEEIRNKICNDKASSDEWLAIHETAHKLGIPSNATMLYGHIENYAHRIDHMNRLRELQDRTNGFNTFIPLKFRNGDNEMSNVKESTIVEDMKCYAMSRIFLDNFNHIKAYWPMIGRTNAQLLLNFGVDDIDGTIDDTTKIYAMAGAEEQNPTMNTRELVDLILAVNRRPIERDTLYKPIRDFILNPFEKEKMKKHI